MGRRGTNRIKRALTGIDTSFDTAENRHLFVTAENRHLSGTCSVHPLAGLIIHTIVESSSLFQPYVAWKKGDDEKHCNSFQFFNVT